MVVSKAADTPTCGMVRRVKITDGKKTRDHRKPMKQHLVKPEEMELLAQGQVEKCQDLKKRQSSEFRRISTFSDRKSLKITIKKVT